MVIKKAAHVWDHLEGTPSLNPYRPYRKTPKCGHTVWGNTLLGELWIHQFSSVQKHETTNELPRPAVPRELLDWSRTPASPKHLPLKSPNPKPPRSDWPTQRHTRPHSIHRLWGLAPETTAPFSKRAPRQVQAPHSANEILSGRPSGKKPDALNIQTPKPAPIPWPSQCPSRTMQCVPRRQSAGDHMPDASCPTTWAPRVRHQARHPRSHPPLFPLPLLAVEPQAPEPCVAGATAAAGAARCTAGPKIEGIPSTMGSMRLPTVWPMVSSDSCGWCKDAYMWALHIEPARSIDPFWSVNMEAQGPWQRGHEATLLVRKCKSTIGTTVWAPQNKQTLQPCNMCQNTTYLDLTCMKRKCIFWRRHKDWGRYVTCKLHHSSTEMDGNGMCCDSYSHTNHYHHPSPETL